MTRIAATSTGRPGFRQFAIYALPALPLAVVVFPSHAILPGFYAQQDIRTPRAHQAHGVDVRRRFRQ